MAQAVGEAARLDPGRCRQLAGERFSVEHVAARYEGALERLATRREVLVARPA